MEKGFTLAEILAVIVLMGIIALTTVSKIQSVLNESKKNTYAISSNSLVREATNYYLTEKAKLTPFAGCSYNFTTDTNTCEGFVFKGDKPKSGKIDIKNNGKIAMAVNFGKFCYLKAYETDEIMIRNYKASTCGETAEVFQN